MYVYVLLHVSMHQLSKFVSLTISVTSAKQKIKIPWRWCKCIETCRSTYDIKYC